MKTLLLSLFSIGALIAAEPAKPAADVQHGRRLEAPGLRAQFVIQSDRKATVTFADAAGKPVPKGDRTWEADWSALSLRTGLMLTREAANTVYRLLRTTAMRGV